jgi:hypothetical protein
MVTESSVMSRVMSQSSNNRTTDEISKKSIPTLGQVESMHQALEARVRADFVVDGIRH